VLEGKNISKISIIISLYYQSANKHFMKFGDTGVWRFK